MRITRVSARNFKSFKTIDINLSNLNVIIGANSAGKSNFIKLLEFIRDITRTGLDEAISIQGDSELLTNMNGDSKKTTISFDIEREGNEPPGEIIPLFSNLIANKLQYNFVLDFSKQGTFRVVDDRFTLWFSTINKSKDKRETGTPEIQMDVESRNGTVSTKIINRGVSKQIEKWLTVHPFKKIPRNKLLLETPLIPVLAPEIYSKLHQISTYYFNARKAKEAISITGSTMLESDGSNLAIFLKYLLKNSENRRKLINYLSDALPFINDVTIEPYAHKFLMVNFKDSYMKERIIPASVIADGTINLTAIICSLFFDTKITAIEELEHNLHPSLIDKTVELLKERSLKKQIIITTHNPQLIRKIDPAHVILISRDNKGISTARHATKAPSIVKFLSEDLGIDELLSQNLV